MKEIDDIIPILLANKKIIDNFDAYEFNFIDNFWKEKCQNIKDILNSDNFKCLDNISYKYQKEINVIFSFSNDSLNINPEKNYENFKNNILLDIKLTLDENDPKEINLIEINKISEGKNITKKFRLIPSILEIINYTISVIKMFLFFNPKNYSKILLDFHDILCSYINLSNDIVLEFKGLIKILTKNELASSYSSINLIQQIINHFIFFISNNKAIEEDIKAKNFLETLSKEYMQKNLFKLMNVIKEGIYESSINEFKKIISLEKYPIVEGDVPVNSFALKLIILVNDVYKALKHCYENDIVSKIILDNLNLFCRELEKLFENKKELSGEEKKQFKRDFIFIRKNIDIRIEDIDFKGFKKEINSLYRKGENNKK